MKFKTVDFWDERIWKKVSTVYLEAFAAKGGKPEKIIRNMFSKKICFLHIAYQEEEALGMAISGKLSNIHSLLIDYFAVRNDMRGKGIGHQLLDYIKEWSKEEGHFDSLLIEVESDETRENLTRIDFWKNRDFTITDYIHHYVWVPEPYRAMYIKLQSDSSFPESGEELFKYIGEFHKASYTKI